MESWNAWPWGEQPYPGMPAEEEERTRPRIPLRRLLSYLALGAIGASIGTQQAVSRFEPEVRTDVALVAEATPEIPRRLTTENRWDVANLNHHRVDHWVRHYTQENREEVELLLRRSGRYRDMISRKLSEQGLPQDLLYLAMIESGFNPRAYSHAHASGLWQFMRPTGEILGLEVNRAVDERNDPIKSTDAALAHLSYLHKRFGSWYLAAAGYNAGEGHVVRALKQVTGRTEGTDASYYRVWSRLPAETRDYVPRMIALARIAKDPAKYGFDEVELDAPYRYDEVEVEAATPLEWVAEAAGTTVEEIRTLNPHFKLERTRADQASLVRIPLGRERAFHEQWTYLKELRRQTHLARQEQDATRGRVAKAPARRSSYSGGR